MRHGSPIPADLDLFITNPQIVFLCTRRTLRDNRSSVALARGTRESTICSFSIGFISISDNSGILNSAGLWPALWLAGGQILFLCTYTKKEPGLRRFIAKDHLLRRIRCCPGSEFDLQLIIIIFPVRTQKISCIRTGRLVRRELEPSDCVRNPGLFLTFGTFDCEPKSKNTCLYKEEVRIPGWHRTMQKSGQSVPDRVLGVHFRDMHLGFFHRWKPYFDPWIN